MWRWRHSETDFDFTPCFGFATDYLSPGQTHPYHLTDSALIQRNPFIGN
jgi:hypothetical protein